MSEAIDPINEFAKALGTANEYYCRLMVTTREEAWEGTIEAIDVDAAAREVRKMIDDYHIRTDNGIEGDELLYVATVGDDGLAEEDEVEVDMRKEGEPFSWSACTLVQELAKLDPVDNTSPLREWIIRAQKLLAKDDDEPAAEPAAS